MARSKKYTEVKTDSIIAVELSAELAAKLDAMIAVENEKFRAELSEVAADANENAATIYVSHLVNQAIEAHEERIRAAEARVIEKAAEVFVSRGWAKDIASAVAMLEAMPKAVNNG